MIPAATTTISKTPQMQVAETMAALSGAELKPPRPEEVKKDGRAGLWIKGGETVTTRIFNTKEGGQYFEKRATEDEDRVKVLAAENAVLVVGGRGCCMCHVVRRLLLGLGANPLVYEVEDEREVVGIDGGNTSAVQFPVVFIGGKMVGGMEWLMAAHITGELVPILKKAGALWL